VWIDYAELASLRTSSNDGVQILQNAVESKYVTVKQVCDLLQVESKKDLELPVSEMITAYIRQFCK